MKGKFISIVALLAILSTWLEASDPNAFEVVFSENSAAFSGAFHSKTEFETLSKELVKAVPNLEIVSSVEFTSKTQTDTEALRRLLIEIALSTHQGELLSLIHI